MVRIIFSDEVVIECARQLPQEATRWQPCAIFDAVFFSPRATFRQGGQSRSMKPKTEEPRHLCRKRRISMTTLKFIHF